MSAELPPLSSQNPFKIVYLYPDDMNFYGDTGNVITAQKRLEARGVPAEVIYHHADDNLPMDADLLLGGGGQDVSQKMIAQDLQRVSGQLHNLASAGVVMLVICGMYQLFGHRFLTIEGDELPGIGLFDFETVGGTNRLTGNVTVDSDFGSLVGYENHSGQTRLGAGQAPLGRVVRGYGNNGQSGEEGAVTANVYGCYLHGSVLPRNPAFADHLLGLALKRRGWTGQLKPLPMDDLAAKARDIIMKRPQ